MLLGGGKKGRRCSSQKGKRLQPVQAGVVGDSTHVDGQDVALGPGVLKHGAEIAVLLGADLGLGVFRPFDFAKQPTAFYPAQAVQPARGRGWLAVLFFVQGLVFVVDHRGLTACGVAGDDLGG